MAHYCAEQLQCITGNNFNLQYQHTRTLVHSKPEYLLSVCARLGKVFNPVVKLVLENQPLQSVCPLCVDA